MIKSWYLSVREETMAPARMVSFMEQHAATCEVCLQDLNLKEEIAKITELVLPESKIPKAIRQASTLDDEPDFDDDSITDTGDEESDDTPVDDEDEDLEELDPEEDVFLEDGEDED